MSKQKRTAGSQKAASSSSSSSKDEPTAEHSNQAVLDQLGSSDRSSVTAVDVDAVRTVAQGLVERGLFALNTTPREPTVVAKYIDVLDTSRLPSDRKAVLIGKLTADQEAAVAAAAAAERCFGDAETGRGVLESVWSGLAGGLEAPEASTVSESAERWITELAGGTAATSFCHEVHLLLLHDEEEEEDEGVIGSFGPEVD